VDLNLSESQQILGRTAREFLAAECTPALVRAIESDPAGYPAQLWRRIVDMGWPGIAVPEAYGGQGADFLDVLVLLQEMGRAALPGPFFSSAVLASLALLEAGRAEQKRKLLPRLCAGELIGTLALSEPGVDFGLDKLATSVRSRQGHYLLNGTKIFVADADIADFMICIAAGDPGVSALVVNKDSPGLSVEPLETTFRDKQFEVVLRDVAVEPHDVLVGLGQARASLDAALQKAMLARCAEMVGAGRKALELSVEYAKVRVQFGKPIGTLQAIQHHCANLATCIETAELMTYKAGWLMQQGAPCRREALHAKAWTNEACKRAAWLAHQIHGGMGFTKEYDLYLYTGRMTSLAQLMGGTAWCHGEIADGLWASSNWT
jgi:alkylation response protein AidB-like acyl-CoA dehydrogenase